MGNFSKKLASSVSMTAIVATSMSASLVSAASEFLPYAEALASHNVINKQTTEAGYRLSDNITRAELAKVAANLGGFPSVSCTGNVYSDVKSNLGDLCDAIETLAAAGVVSKTNATFRPNANVTRAEMTKMLVGAVGGSPSNVDAGYADTANLGDLTGFINRAREMGAINAATNFRPNASGSRGEVFKIATLVAGMTVNHNNPTPTPTPVQTGSVSVSAVGSPAAQYVPLNASSVKVGTIKLTAQGGGATVNTVTVHRSGLGVVNGLRASLAQNGVIVGNARTFNNTSQEVVIRLNTPVVLSAGASIELDVLASLPDRGTPNSQHQFAVTGVNGNAVSSVTLGLLNTTSYEVKDVDVRDLTTHNQRSGLNGVRLADLTIVAPSGRDVTVSGFTISKNSGNDLTQAISNLKVFRNGVEITGAKVTVTSDKIIVTQLGTKLPASESAKYELRGDTIYVGNDGKYKLYVANTEDVSATEDATGYVTRVNNTTAEKQLEITGIKITTTLVDTTTRNVAPGTTGVNFLDGKLTSSASFEVLGYKLRAQVNGNPATEAQLKTIFSSLSFDIAGSSYDLLATAPTSSGEYLYTSSDSFNVDAGQNITIRVRGSVKADVNTTTYGNVRFTFETQRLKNVDSGNTFDHTTTDLAGNTINLRASTLDVRGATVAAPSTKNISSSINGVEIGRFALEAKNADVRVSKITVENVVATNAIANLRALADNASSYRLVDISNNTEIEATKEFSAANDKVTFEFAPAITINKDTIKNIKLTVDTKNITEMGKKFQAKFTLVAGDVSTDNGSVTLVSADETSSEYTTAISMPRLKVSPVTLLQNSPVAKVDVENTDADNNTAISKLKIRVQARSTANNSGNFDFSGVDICLRNNGATVTCGAANTIGASTGAVNGAVYEFTMTGTINAGGLVSTLSSTDFEVFMSNAPLWVAGDHVAVSVEEVEYKYGTGTTVADLTGTVTETYVGVADASAVSTK